MDFAAEVLAAVVPELEARGVVLAIEPLGPQETNFLLTAADGVELIDRLASRHVRLHLDCKAMATEATPIVDLIRRNSIPGWPTSTPTIPIGKGRGLVNSISCRSLRALDEVDYHGWVSVEVFDYTPGIERLARESIEYMRRCCGDAEQ